MSDSDIARIKSKVLLPPDLLEILGKDEETFMDRASMGALVVEEGESPSHRFPALFFDGV